MSISFRNKKIGIIGLGIEGKDALRFLVGQGAYITVFDKKKEKELDTSGVSSLKLDLICGEDYLKHLSGFDVIVRSPGVRPDLPEIVKAQKNGAVITSSINIFFELCPAKIIGVTGTKGKGTTATLIHECLTSSGVNSYLAGNIGKPYLELLDHLNENDIVVLELSSFQLIDAQISPHIAVVINITTDHLDWHKDREEYILAKQNIVHFQEESDFAVLAKDYEDSLSFERLTRAEVYYFSTEENVKGSYVEDGVIYLNENESTDGIGKVENLVIRGKHNWENVCAAVISSRLAGATVDGIKKAVFSFKGLPHRIELVGEKNDITFYNDSFATSPSPSLAAVRAFEEQVVVILGGSAKGFSYREFGQDLAKQENLKAAIVIGQTGPEIKEALLSAGYAGQILEGGGNMEGIIKTAMSVANPGDVVLLSPAAASFDMFKDYKDRGNQFKVCIKRLRR